MADEFRYFLKIDGIQGDSSDRKYPKPWIALPGRPFLTERWLYVFMDAKSPAARDLLARMSNNAKPTFGHATVVKIDKSAELGRVTLDDIRVEKYASGDNKDIAGFVLYYKSMTSDLGPRLRAAAEPIFQSVLAALRAAMTLGA